MPTHLDTKELLTHGLLIKYHSARPPDAATKKLLIAATRKAREYMLTAVWEIDKVVLFRRDEKAWMTALLNKHFGLNRDTETEDKKDGNGKLINASARRRYLNKVRDVMLPTSVGLNTGTYLLDVDGWKRPKQPGINYRIARGFVNRSVKVDAAGDPLLDDDGVEQYYDPSFIHVSFNSAGGSSAERTARTIIHEATHRFANTADVAYASQSNYDQEPPNKLLHNADSFAFAAISIAAKNCLDDATAPM